MTGYYDLILVLIPTALFGITGTLTGLTTLGLTTAVPIAAGIAILFVAHALFVNGPGGSLRSRRSSSLTTDGGTDRSPVHSAD